MNDTISAGLFWMLFHKSFFRQISGKFGPTFAADVMRGAKPNFFGMVRRMPPLGKHNPKRNDLIFTVFVASIYQAGGGKITLAQIGPIMTGGTESVSVFRRFAAAGDHFNKKWQDRRSAQAVISQRKVYPADFVFAFHYGKTTDEYGVDYYECAILKLLQREGCAELTPLFCNYDYIMAKYMHANLIRSKTLAFGGDLCDFWYTKNT